MQALPASITHIRLALAQPLPGLSAMLAMLPAERRAEVERYHTLPAGGPAARPAAALILLYPSNGEWYFPLTRRTEWVETHKGQISLPGGAQEAGESLPETALRETYEEVGAEPAQISLIGALSPIYIPPSNFCLHPFVAYTWQRPNFQIVPSEVAELIETPLASVCDPANQREEEWVLQGQRRRVPFYQVASHKVWGATAMVLSEFVAIVNALA